MRISDWSSDVCSSDLFGALLERLAGDQGAAQGFQELDGAVLSGAATRHLHGRLGGAGLLGQLQSSGIVQHLQVADGAHAVLARSEEHTSELQSLMRISYAVFCLKNKNQTATKYTQYNARSQ